MAKFLPAFERCEDRTLMTLIFVLNGNSFNPANPNDLTANAAAILHKAGNRVVQLSNAHINSAAAFKSLASAVTRMAHGQTVGLVGFSAGACAGPSHCGQSRSQCKFGFGLKATNARCSSG